MTIADQVPAQAAAQPADETPKELLEETRSRPGFAAPAPLHATLPEDLAAHPSKMTVAGLSIQYGTKLAVRDVTLDVPERAVTAFIGPSGCGKSTILRCLDRMNDLIPTAKVGGTVTLDGEDIYAPDVQPVDVRRRIGLVFQRPNPFPMTIYDNVAYGPRRYGEKDRKTLDEARRAGAPSICPVGRGQGRLQEEVGPRAVGRPAAAAVHRPHAGDRAPRSC